jgi:hypothetical protein
MGHRCAAVSYDALWPEHRVWGSALGFQAGRPRPVVFTSIITYPLAALRRAG